MTKYGDGWPWQASLYQNETNRLRTIQQRPGKRVRQTSLDHVAFEQLLGSAALGYSFALNAGLFLTLFMILAAALLANLPNFLYSMPMIPGCLADWLRAGALLVGILYCRRSSPPPPSPS